MAGSIHARFDKEGRRLPDTGHGCGCGQCAESGAARYERRSRPRADGSPAAWGSPRRAIARALRFLERGGRPEAA